MTLRYTPQPGQRGAAARSAKPYVARLAMLRAHGETIVAGPARLATNWLASAAVYLGVAAAGAVWIGGSLFDLREAANRTIDQAAAAAGFAVRMQIEGIEGERAEEVRAAALPSGWESMVFASPQDMRTRLMGLDWVGKVVVQRHWPDRVKILIERKAPIYSAPRRGAA
jgi:hypothetical protein